MSIMSRIFLEGGGNVPRKTKHIGSKALERKVDKAYLKKGYTSRKAKYIAGAVAGKVYREQKRKKKSKEE